MSFNIKNGTLIKYSGEEKEIRIPKEVTKIASGAFVVKENNIKIIVPAEVSLIQYDAISCHSDGCMEIIIEGYSTLIQEDAFWPYTSLMKIVLPEDYFFHTKEIRQKTVVNLLQQYNNDMVTGFGLDLNVSKKDYAALLLFQTNKELIDCVGSMTRNFVDEIVLNMIDLLGETEGKKYYAVAAKYAIANSKKIKMKTMDALYEAAELGGATPSVMKMLNPFVSASKKK